jgi:hypothetical protein
MVDAVASTIVSFLKKMHDPIEQKSQPQQYQNNVIHPLVFKQLPIKQVVQPQHRHGPEHGMHGKRTGNIQMQQAYVCPGHTTPKAGNVQKVQKWARNLKQQIDLQASDQQRSGKKFIFPILYFQNDILAIIIIKACCDNYTAGF